MNDTPRTLLPVADGGSPRCPSTSLLTAALAGLLAAGLAGCDDGEGADPIIENPTGSAPQLADSGVVPAPATAPDAGPITTLEVEGNRTLASLKADCDSRGGFMQVHAACAGANNCQGFSYLSGNPGTLTEHTCASANGCGGASCVVLPKDKGLTGKQAYEQEDLPAGGPASCLNCHAVWGEKNAAGEYPPPDATKFKLWLVPGSPRNITNWLQLSAAEQEAIVAFGKVGTMPDGTAQVSMRGYHKLLSREEIKRAVAHIRTLTPVLAEIKSPP